MLTLASLRNIYEGMQADADAAAAMLVALDNAIQKYKVDGSRSPAWIAEKIAEARAQHLPAIREKVATFDERLATMKAQKRYWQSTPFVLSHRTFNSNPTNDAMIAARYRGECAAMSGDVLQLTAESAKEDGNLALLWQCVLAGNERQATSGWKGVRLDDVKIPEQKQALDLIEAAEGAAWLAHSTHAVASGGVLTGTDKLIAARIKQARLGPVPTTHNSPGRAPPKAP